MDVIAWACLVAACVTTVMAWFGPDDAWVLSLLNVVACVTTVLAWRLDQLGALPVLDLLVGLLAVTIYAMQPGASWRALFLIGAVVQVALDAWYGCTGASVYYAYAVLYNGAFGVELVALASAGGVNGRRRMFRSWRDFHRSVCAARKA